MEVYKKIVSEQYMKKRLKHENNCNGRAYNKARGKKNVGKWRWMQHGARRDT